MAAVKWAGFVFLAVLLQWVFAIVAFEAPVARASCTALNALVCSPWPSWRVVVRARSLADRDVRTEVAATR